MAEVDSAKVTVAPETESLSDAEEVHRDGGYPMPSGQVAYGLKPSVTQEVMLATPTDRLRHIMFGVEPTEVPGWATMPKRALKKSLVNLQWEKLRAEKKRRREAKATAASAATMSCVSGQKRARPADVDAEAAEESRASTDPTSFSGKRAMKKESWLAIANSGIRVVVDCAFQECMILPEKRSLNLQLEYCYSVNRRAKVPCRLVFTSVVDFHTQSFSNQMGYDKWPLDLFKEDFMTLLRNPGPVTAKDVRCETAESASIMPDVLTSPGADNLVYLTADSDHVVRTLDPSKIYIVGGLVDRNRHKGITAKRAAEFGIATARLPLDEYVDMKTTNVLTTNHVVEILLKYSESGSWAEALLAVLPGRKGASAVGDVPGGECEESEHVDAAAAPEH